MTEMQEININERPISNPEFKVHVLNEQGIYKAKSIAIAFDNLLDFLMNEITPPGTSFCREMAIVKTKLEEACFFAKKAMATKTDNQK